MKERIILLNNAIIAYVLFSIIYIYPYWINIITGTYKMYDVYRDSLGDYLSLLLEGFGVWETIFLFLNLLPFQLVKIKWLYKYPRDFYIKSIGCYILFNILLCYSRLGWVFSVAFKSLAIWSNFYIRTISFFNIFSDSIIFND